MFWMLRGPKLAANFIHNVINNNFTSNGDTDGCGLRAKGYNRLSSLEDEINGNMRPSDLNVTSAAGYPYLSKDNSSNGSTHSMTSYQEKMSRTPSSTLLSPDMEMAPNSYASDSTSFYSTRPSSSNATSPTSTSDVERISFQSMDTSSLTQLDYEYEEETEDSDEELTCNVCDRSYSNIRQLLSHQMRRRHYGCSVCENIFPTWMALEAHKEMTGHVSDDEDEEDFFYNEDDDNWDFYEDDEDERERLL